MGNPLADTIRAMPHAQLTRQEMAALERVSGKTIYRRELLGLIPAPIRKAGRRSPLWSRDELAAWVEAGQPPREDWENIQRLACKVAPRTGKGRRGRK